MELSQITWILIAARSLTILHCVCFNLNLDVSIIIRRGKIEELRKGILPPSKESKTFSELGFSVRTFDSQPIKREKKVEARKASQNKRQKKE